jgi:hypothetical protein
MSTDKKTHHEGQTWSQIRDGKSPAESQSGRLSVHFVNDGVKAHAIRYTSVIDRVRVFLLLHKLPGI